MGHLGEFGTAREPNASTFGYFGATVRVHPNLSDLAVMDLFAAMSEAGEDGTKAVQALKAIADVLVHPDDVPAFWTLAKDNRQTMTDLAELATKMLGALTERPTELPSDSSGGQSPTVPKSGDDSFSRAMHLSEGRPDRQLVLIRQREHQEAQAG